MVTVRTMVGTAWEAARRVRFEPTGPITATTVQDAIVQANSLPRPIITTPVTFAMSPYTAVNSDSILLVNTSAGVVTINLQPAAARGGLDLTIKDVTGNAAANPISVVRNGAETIDGLTTYPMDSNYGAATFSPQVGGYFVKP